MLMRSALLWDITRCRTLDRVQMGPIRCPETSVNNYHTTPLNIPEERRSQQHISTDESLRLYTTNKFNKIKT
jgi:hypothetical protein